MGVELSAPIVFAFLAQQWWAFGGQAVGNGKGMVKKTSIKLYLLFTLLGLWPT